MPERPIHLDLRSSSGSFDERLSSSAHHLSEAPDAETTHRFREALNGDPVPTDSVVSAAPGSPFDLLKRASDTPAPTQVLSTLSSMVQQLMVGEGLVGRRTLRPQINPEVLPGVSVTVTEDAGAWVADFECQQEDSFLRLARSAQEMAPRLAQMLQQDAVWRVTALGLPDEGAWTSWLQSHLDRPGMEACASPPGGCQ